MRGTSSRRLEARSLGLLAGAAGGLLGLLIVARVLPIEFSAAHTGRLAPGPFAELSQVELARESAGREPRTAARQSPADETQWPDEIDEETAIEPAAFFPPASVPATRTLGASASLTALTATDLHGWTYRPGGSTGCRAVVLVFLSPDCPIANGSIPELNRLVREFAPRGVEWFGVVAERGVSRRQAVEHYALFKPEFPVLFDASGELLLRLGPTHVPQCFVVDHAGHVLYSGAIDDRYASLGRRRPQATRSFLAQALDDVLSGRPVAVPRTEPVGCLVEDRAMATGGEVTWCRDVAPIVFAHCVACHRPGEVGPFPLTGHPDASRRARQIALVAAERLMPPWKPEPGFGHFRSERRLSDRQIEVLSRWAAAGAPFGDPADLPPLPRFTSGWQLGQPDLVLELPEEFAVPADGNDVYQYFVLPTGLTRDRVITAIEFRPASPEVVHHASFCYDTSGAARRLDAAEPGPGYRRFGGAGFTPAGTLGGWAPGVTPQHLPDGLGREIKAGADLVVQVHYHPIGRPVRDRPRIGLYFARTPVRRKLAELIVADMNLRIPAGAGRWVHRASYTLPVDVTVHAVAPHMHLLGREMTVTAERPGGRVVPLIRIADWDFNWQDVYFYARPLRLPAGTRIDVECVYDNSAANPFNPHSPPRDVHWGERSIDEMGICYFDVTTDWPDDLARLLEHNQAVIARQLREHPWLLEPPPEFRGTGAAR